jgi:hypothetical protein
MNVRMVRMSSSITLCVAAVLLGIWCASALAAAPRVEEQWVGELSATGSTLHAVVNPEGSDSSYRFEYDTSAYLPGVTHGIAVPASPVDVGSGTSGVKVSVNLQNLLANTAYHFRVVVTQGSEITYGPEESFTTQSAGSEFSLPDGRAYEMVSPPQKYGAEVDSLHLALETPAGGITTQAGEDGGAITYETNSPIVPNPAGNTSITQVLSNRGPNGWSSQDISIPGDRSEGLSIGLGQDYRLFSSDLSLGALEPVNASTRLSPETPSEAGHEIYVRSPSGAYQPLIVNANGWENALLVGASPDLRHIIFVSGYAFTKEAQKIESEFRGIGNLYEWSAGELKLVNVLPDGEATHDVNSLGNREHNMHPVSDDGRYVVWQTVNNSKLYSRDMVADKTVQVDASQGGSEEGGNGAFQLASSDGSKVFFTESHNLTPQSNTGLVEEKTHDLYMFDIKTNHLVDLTVDQMDARGADVLAVLGGSRDGTSIYFLAHGVLASGGVTGQNNVYVAHDSGSGWTTTLVGTLSAEDLAGYAIVNGLTSLDAEVSPSGAYMAFMSNRSLTGYDNLDANSGRPDEEVYLYDATAGRLVCASCNRSGARPVGEFDVGYKVGASREEREHELFMDPYGIWEGQWLGASLLGWNKTETGSTVLYQPRYLSDEGRLVFDSADALVAHDTNGTEDVYQYEPDEVGGAAGCREVAGCVSLITSGTGSAPSGLVDTSANGDDIFVMTRDHLSASDFDNAYDVYDVHVCSTTVPCIPQPPVAPPACSSGDSCKASPTPQPAIFGSPSSATFSGAGNIVAPASRTVTSRSLTRRQKLARALAACTVKPRRSRSKCVSTAKKRYGHVPKARRSRSTKSLSAGTRR